MQLSLNEFVAAVLWGSVALVGFFSLVSRFLHARAERKLVGMKTVCRLCGNVFITPHSGKLTDCTACGKPNLHRRNGRLG
jgi:hypothetical protein